VVALYRSRLPTDAIRLVEIDARSTSAYHQHVAILDERDAVRAKLAERGIQTGIHYPIPCHLQKPYRRYAAERLPVVEESAGRIISLPLYPQMTESEVDRVTEALRDALEVSQEVSYA